jgi:two-component system chemotaxis sensor kinase CheA
MSKLSANASAHGLGFSRALKRHRTAHAAAHAAARALSEAHMSPCIESISRLEHAFGLAQVTACYLPHPELEYLCEQAQQVLVRLAKLSAPPHAQCGPILTSALDAIEQALWEVELGRPGETAGSVSAATEMLHKLRLRLEQFSEASSEDLELFIEDAEQLLSQGRAGLLAACADEGPGRTAHVQAAFRALHTLKGNAGLMGRADQEAMAHAIEDVLSALRASELVLTNTLTVALIDLLERAAEGLHSQQGVPWHREAAMLATARAEAEQVARSTRLGVLLVEHQLVTPEQVELALAIRKAPLGEALVRLNALTAGELSDALEWQRSARRGERPGSAGGPSRRASLVRKSLPSAHDLQCLDGVFRKAEQAVYGISTQLGKTAVLTTRGADIHAPPRVVNALGQAVLHLVRNAIDHGVESEQVRVARGKPAHASLELSATLSAGTLQVVVRDDGHGLDVARIRARAVALGIVTTAQAAALTEPATLQLLFAPGFTTADNVSHISGRGMGMDAVKVAIEAAGGSVALRSKLGEGLEVHILFPNVGQAPMIPALSM